MTKGYVWNKPSPALSPMDEQTSIKLAPISEEQLEAIKSSSPAILYDPLSEDNITTIASSSNGVWEAGTISPMFTEDEITALKDVAQPKKSEKATVAADLAMVFKTLEEYGIAVEHAETTYHAAEVPKMHLVLAIMPLSKTSLKSWELGNALITAIHEKGLTV